MRPSRRSFSLVSVALALVVAFVLGQATNPGASSAAADGHVYTGRLGDVFRVPGAAARCEVSQEAGAPNLICFHVPRARYSVVFFKDDLLVYRNGNPDKPVFRSATP
jgi:hypothetical protein